MQKAMAMPKKTTRKMTIHAKYTWDIVSENAPGHDEEDPPLDPPPPPLRLGAILTAAERIDLVRRYSPEE
jgi:hypothetical protein